MTFDEKYPVTSLYQEVEPQLIRYRERGNEEYCVVCSEPTRWFFIETQEYVCSKECLAEIKARDAAVANAEDIVPDAPLPESRLVAGRIEENWMDRQAKIELRDLLAEHPEFVEEVKSLSPGDALVHIFQKLGGKLPS